MKVLTGDRRFDDMDFDTLPQGGSSMFSIIDRAENRGLVRGRAEGIITGRAEGIITGRAEGIITGANRMAEKMDQNIQALLESKQITEEAAALLRAGLKNN